jgi:hypothetical protein
MWGLGQDTLLGIFVGVWTSGSTLYWVLLLVYVPREILYWVLLLVYGASGNTLYWVLLLVMLCLGQHTLLAIVVGL